MIHPLLGDDLIDPLTGQLYSDETAAQVQQAANEFNASQAAAQSPAGSKWQFQGAWTSSRYDPLAGLSAQDVISKLGVAVAPDFAIVASTPNPAYQILSGSISVTLVDNTGHAQISDGQSVIQNAFASIVGSGNVQSNTAQMVAGPSTGGVFTPGASNPTVPSGTPPPPGTPSSIPSWVWYAGAGVVGLIVVGAAVRH